MEVWWTMLLHEYCIGIRPMPADNLAVHTRNRQSCRSFERPWSLNVPGGRA